VLASGAVPLQILEQRIDAWIEAQAQAGAGSGNRSGAGGQVG